MSFNHANVKNKNKIKTTGCVQYFLRCGSKSRFENGSFGKNILGLVISVEGLPEQGSCSAFLCTPFLSEK